VAFRALISTIILLQMVMFVSSTAIAQLAKGSDMLDLKGSALPAGPKALILVRKRSESTSSGGRGKMSRM